MKSIIQIWKYSRHTTFGVPFNLVGSLVPVISSLKELESLSGNSGSVSSGNDGELPGKVVSSVTSLLWRLRSSDVGKAILSGSGENELLPDARVCSLADKGLNNNDDDDYEDEITDNYTNKRKKWELWCSWWEWGWWWIMKTTFLSIQKPSEYKVCF